MEARFAARSRAWSVDEAAAVAAEAFGIDGTAHLLTSERDQNFRIDAADRAYVLKVTHPAEPREVTAFQTAVQVHAVERGAPVPRLHRARDGAWVATADLGAGPQALRLIDHVDGVPMARAPRTARQRGSLGAALAVLDRALADLDAPVPDLELLWNSERVDALAHLLVHLEDADARERVTRVLGHHLEVALPRQAALRRQLIHNDGNPSNVMVADDGDVAALLDLGDMVIAPLVQEVAVAAAYLVESDGHPLAAPADLVAGFHATLPLSDEELALLPHLMRARMLTTILITEWRARAFPENRAYILRNNPSAWAGLGRLDGIGEDEALTRFRLRIEEDA